MSGKVGYLRTNKTPIKNRVCRSVYSNGTDEEWAQVIDSAVKQGSLPNEMYMKDIADFNQRGAAYGGTVKEFLASELRPKRTKRRRG